MSEPTTSREQLLAALSEQVRALPASRRLIPRVIARAAEIPAWQAVGLLRLLEEQGLGKVRLQVRDPVRRMEVGIYRTADDVPRQHPDVMGDLFEVNPEDVQLVFVPTQGLAAENVATGED